MSTISIASGALAGQPHLHVPKAKLLSIYVRTLLSPSSTTLVPHSLPNDRRLLTTSPCRSHRHHRCAAALDDDDDVAVLVTSFVSVLLGPQLLVVVVVLLLMLPRLGHV